MKLTERLSGFLDRGSRVLPYVTGWLWALGLIGSVYYALQWTSSGESGFIFLFIALAVSSLVAKMARLRNWRSEAWLSLITWVCALTVANLLLLEHMTEPFGATYWFFGFVDGTLSFPETVWESAKNTVMSLLSLRWFLVLSAFALVYELHRRRLASPRTGLAHAIGGRWGVVQAVIAGVVVAIIIEATPPFGMITVSMWSISDSTDQLISWIDRVIAWTAAFAFYAWKTGALLTVDERGIRVGLAENGLGLFSIPWRRVLRIRELGLRGRRESAVIEVGYLPVFRAKFSLHRTRDGEEVLEKVFDEAQRQGVLMDHAVVRRGTALVGWTLLASALACTWLVQWLIAASTNKMANAEDHDIAVFTSADHFILFGGLTACAALLLGFGLGLLFARTDGGMRAVPLIGVAVAGAMLPDPLLYWLVYIAIFSILIARIGPIEPLPAVPFPDNDVSSMGLWLVCAKGLFAVGGYLLATMAAVKPWYRALPTWPYSTPWEKKRALVEVLAATEAKLESGSA